MAPISAGFYRLEPGTPLVYEYTYHEMKIIVSGSFDISDETGKKVHAVAGDVFYFPKGAKVCLPDCILWRGVEIESDTYCRLRSRRLRVAWLFTRGRGRKVRRRFGRCG
jgi:hypothetical protein